MVCIYCNSSTNVTNSRLQKRANQVWRRRRCTSCGANFTTHEVVDLGSSIAVQRSSKDIQPFSRDRLFTSVYDSLKHRPDSLGDATALTLTIISQLLPHVNNGRLEREVIAAVTGAVLERFDMAASTVYSAYHPQNKRAN
jgi:transcriptional regulator NrdR family protein